MMTAPANSVLEGDTRDTAQYLLRAFDHPATYLWRTLETALLKAFMRRYALESPVLDLGCAEGTIARSLFGASDTVIGLDNCWELLSASRSTEPYRWRLLGDGCRLPFEDGVFASVFSNCVIEHIPDLERLLSEVSRVLRQGGTFMLTVPSDSFARDLFFSRVFSTLGLQGAARAYGEKRNALLHHFHCYDAGSWRDKLKHHGLRLVDGATYMPRGLLMLWDALAAYFFVAARIPLLGRAQMLASKLFLKAAVLNGPAYSCESGGALLMVAIKG